MKKSIIIILAAALTSQAFTLQSREITVTENKQVSISDSSANVTVIIGKDFLRFDGNDSLVLIRMGERGMNIRKSSEDSEEQEPYRGARNFRGHWAGFEAGFNNYVHINSMTMPEEIAYMSLDASKSNCFNLNFSQANIGLSRHFGIVSGLGVTFNNYRFENQNSIVAGQDGTISGSIPIDVSVKKSKFSTLYLNVPVMLEVQIPAGYSHRLNIAAGVIGGLKLNAWTKVVFENGEKNRVNGDYNLNLLRGGVTARIGYGNLMIFGTYYMTPWFQNLKGPNGYNLKPFEIGLAFTFND
jgi:hypothetical protein